MEEAGGEERRECARVQLATRLAPGLVVAAREPEPARPNSPARPSSHSCFVCPRPTLVTDALPPSTLPNTPPSSHACVYPLLLGCLRRSSFSLFSARLPLVVLRSPWAKLCRLQRSLARSISNSHEDPTSRMWRRETSSDGQTTTDAANERTSERTDSDTAALTIRLFDPPATINRCLCDDAICWCATKPSARSHRLCRSVSASSACLLCVFVCPACLRSSKCVAMTLCSMRRQSWCARPRRCATVSTM